MIVNNKKITYNDIIEKVNEGYDRGGADVLKIILTTLDTLS